MGAVEQLVVVGIDVSKQKLDVCCAPGDGCHQFGNDTKGIAELVAWCVERKVSRAAMEGTGGLELEVALALDAAGISVAIVNPRQMRRFAEASGRLEKSDRIDSGVIAQFALRMEHRPTKLPDEKQRELASLVSRRRQLSEMIVAEENRLSMRALPARVTKSVKATLRFLERELAKLDDDIDTQMRSSPIWQEDLRLLESIPGVGRITASTLLAEMPELRSCNKRQLAKLVGVAPLPYESGSMRGARAIYGGRATVRAKLYMAALTATRHNPRIKAHYRQLLARGKKRKVAIVACMHKLLDIIRSMLVHKTEWRQTAAAAA